MRLDHLQQPGFNTTMMGVLKGAADHYRIALSEAMLFGGSGHAFLMNIHSELCPSGPYCWNVEPFYPLVQNLGIQMTTLGFFWSGSGPAERSAVEALVKYHLDEGEPCSLLNLENQLITGYDDTGFFTAQPWPGSDFPPSRLTFENWAEFGTEIHASFMTFRKAEPAPVLRTVSDSLRYAIDLWRNPTAHTCEPYGAGPNAYSKWIDAVENGHGCGHGSWWNATVWSECRRMAAGYFEEIADRLPRMAVPAQVLAADYREIASALNSASDKQMPAAEKVDLLEQACVKESGSITKIEEMVTNLGE